MINRFLILAAGILLAAGAVGFSYLRQATQPAAAVISLEDGGEAQAALAAAASKPTPSKGTVLYACADGRAFGVEYGKPGGVAEITINGGTSKLDPVFVAEGAEYSDGVLTLVTKGDVAEVHFGEETAYGDCQARR
jgi:membrane-bound inhibitor of C-type lysozyme